MEPRLEIYIERGCENCNAAKLIADRVREQMPEVQLSLIDLVREPHRRPKDVFAVPTYLLDGEILSLGNPRLEDLLAALSEKTETSAHEVVKNGKLKNSRTD